MTAGRRWIIGLWILVGLMLLAGTGRDAAPAGAQGRIVREVGYEPAERILTVLFRDGSRVRFHDVDAGQFGGLLRQKDRAGHLYREFLPGFAVEFAAQREGEGETKTNQEEKK